MRYFCIFAAGLFGGAAAHASLVFTGPAAGNGSGIGSTNVVLTIQNTGTESGCVGWNGTANVVGSAACPGGLSPAIAGGNEKTGSSQTQTQTIAATGITSAANLAVLFNVNEPAGNSIQIENISVTIYSPTGAILFNSGNMTGIPLFLPDSQQGQGNLGFAFVLDTAEAAAAQPFWSNLNNRIGVAGLVTNAAGSNDTFSVADRLAAGVTPEPSTFLMVGGMLALAIFLRSRLA